MKIENNKIITYKDICNKLFKNSKQQPFYIDSFGCVNRVYGTDENDSVSDIYNTAVDKEQLESLLSINKLANVAKYLNEGWIPDWKKNNNKFYVYYVEDCDDLIIKYTIYTREINVYFKSEKLIKQAIMMLGKKEVINALTLNY